jgi:uncharacterized membrane protein YdjX (TVP38/TMEM64 family)
MASLMSPKQAAFLLLVLMLLAAGIYVAGAGELGAWLHAMINEETHNGLFILLYFILPLAGCPITIFLLLLGVKFDIWIGVLIMFAGMAFHAAAIFPAANTVLRPLIEKILRRSRYRLPQFSHGRYAWPSIIFMVVPGISYTMKDYILSLSGLRFWPYFLIAWLAQAILGIPVVVAGDMLRRLPFWLVLLFFVLMGGLFTLYRRFCKGARSA